MSLSTLPLSYCTNVHPGRTLLGVEAGLDTYTVPVAAAFGRPLAAGLWLAKPVIDELLKAPEGPKAFAAGLAGRGLTCHTLNAFPFGDFHSERVKEQVYLPDWTTRNRLFYTQQCATVLAELLPDGVDGSISTLPLGFKGFEHPATFEDVAAGRLIEVVSFLRKLKERTGKTIRLAIEPEPYCVLETTAEAIAFFQKLWAAARRSKLEAHVREHIGLCYDVCHQAVEFEDIAGSIQELTRAGVRIAKVHLSCALQLDAPATNADGREALRRYVEERYLHQTMAASGGSAVAEYVDLSADLIDNPPPEFASADAWRIHYHVPVDADALGPLGTTRPQLKEAIAAVAKLDYAPHLEVETYTWDVLPGAKKPDLVAGLSRELLATQALLADAVAV
jgi:sugar phosphate isomerase/epimerase